MPIPRLRRRSADSWRDYRVTRGLVPSKAKRKRIFIKRLVLAFLALIVVGLVAFFLYAAWISRDLPNPNQLINRDVAQSTKIYDRTGQTVLYEISGDQKRTLVTLQAIPDYVKEATIAIEDKDFYKHGGFSVWAMFRTAVTDVLFNRSAGGSTLTQQFVKNAVLTSEKTFSRKIKELVLSYRLEKQFSKDDILQMYLNEIPYGSNAYGVEAASQKYFGKDVQNVSLAEAAVLAAIVQTPSYYSPYGPNKGQLLNRKDYVLDLMAQQGYISTAERDAAKKEEIKFAPPGTNIIAPHFVMYIKDILDQKYGEQMVEQGGLKIYTTLDLYKQKAAEDAITNDTKTYPQRFNANNAALVAIDPKTGQILAMVGSRDYFDDSIDGQVNVATSPRQPGSSMKPVVYSALFEKGYTPNTILYDVDTNFSTDPTKPYEPHDYDGKNRGPVTIRQALAGSLNIPAVKAIYLADINNVIDLAENMGYSTLYPRSRFGLSLVLGGAEVKLLEHTNAYSAFARDGQISPIVSILKVEDKDGNVIDQYQPSSKKVLDAQVVREINSVLTDNDARAFIFGVKNFLTFGDRQVAAKTGTTNDYHDAWTIGYTPSLVAGVWVGNSDNKAMSGKADGSILAAPIWHDFMAKVLGNTPKETFLPPDDYTTGKPVLDGQIATTTLRINISTGQPATDSTPPELVGQKTVPVYHEILYYIDKNDPLGPPPADPASDPQFSLWETGVQKWLHSATGTSPLYASSTAFLGVPNGPQPLVSIASPTIDQAVTAPSLSVQAAASSSRNIIRTEYYINNNLWLTQSGAPAVVSQSINFLNNGYHALRVRVCDETENCGEASVDFNVMIPNNPVSAGQNSLQISAPADGLSVTAANFPVPVALSVGLPARTAGVALLIRNETSGLVTAVKNQGAPIGNTVNLSWDQAPAAGAYAVYGQLTDWNGDTVKSNEVRVTVN